ncbi:TolB family protein [Amycolatopsis sp. NPDC004378]
MLVAAAAAACSGNGPISSSTTQSVPSASPGDPGAPATTSANGDLPRGPALVLANHAQLQFVTPQGSVAAAREYPGSGRPITDLDKASFDPTYSKIASLGDPLPYQATAMSYEAGYITFDGEFHRVTPPQDSYSKRRLYTGALFIGAQLAVDIDNTTLVWAATGDPVPGGTDPAAVDYDGYAGPACAADTVTRGQVCESDGTITVTLSKSNRSTFGHDVPAGPVLGVAPDGSAIVRSPDNRLYSVSRKTGDVRGLTPETDYIPTSAAVSPDGGTVAFTAERDTTTALFLVAGTGGTPTPLPNYTPLSGAMLRTWLG